MNATLLLRALPAAALLALPLACGGGGGGGGATTAAASSAQVAQAVLVATASINGVSAASDTSTGGVTTSSVAATSVRAAAMGDGMMGSSGTMDMGRGSFSLHDTSCGETGTVDMDASWSASDSTTGCVDGLKATLDFNQCADTADQSMHGTMGMTIAGTTCDPTAIDMDFSGVTVTTPDGTLSGDFTVGMGNMTFNGDPADFDITAATMTLNGRMQMAGSGFPTVDMEMDHLAFHFDDTTNTGDINGTLTVRCSGQAYPMTMATEPGGLTLDGDGNVVSGQMTVTAEGTAHQVTFSSDGSVDVTPAGGTTVHLDGPVSQDFCD